ncbi:MAG: hypothetical protein ABF289_15490, partial [Clostridiales bacterium]
YILVIIVLILNWGSEIHMGVVKDKMGIIKDKIVTGFKLFNKFTKKYKLFIIIIFIILIFIFFYMLTNKDNFIAKNADNIISNLYEKVTGKNSKDILPGDINSENITDSNSLDSIKEKESNNDVNNSNTIKLKHKYEGNLSDEKDIDYYKFTITNKSKVSIEFEHDNSKDGGFEIKVLDSNKKEISNYLSLTNLEKKSSNQSIVFSTLRLPKGDYFLSIDDYKIKKSIDIDYFFRIIAKEENDTFETEFNNSIDKSSKIVIDSPTIGNLSNNSDIDCFSLELKESKKITIDLKQASTGLLVGKLNLKLENKSGQILHEFNYDANSNSNKVQSIVLEKDIYYIKITTKETITVNGDYELKIK